MKAIVITTINEPTRAIIEFSKLNNWNLYIVGDLKTPHKLFANKNWKYLHPDYQDKNYKNLSNLIGWNSIQRRNIGFLEAIKDGAKIVASVDDDNIPKKTWGSNLLIGKTIKIKSYENKKGLFDPLSITNISKYWHRGYPLELVKDRFKNTKKTKKINVKVQVGLWDGYPDIDATSKILNGNKKLKIFGKFPYSSKKTIFSSQNVFFHRSIMPYFSVLPHCERMDDIWGCILMQQRTGVDVVFTKPSTYHERNYHDIISDLRKEIMGYEKTTKILKKQYEVLQEKTLQFIKEYEKEMKCYIQ